MTKVNTILRPKTCKMTIVQSTIKKRTKLESSNSLRAKFFYPILVLFEDTTSFRLLDLEGKKESHEEEKLFKLDEDIRDCVMQDHFLWTALINDEFVVTNVLNGSQLKIIVNNYSHLKFHEANDNKFYFKSDGGEYLFPPYSTAELTTLTQEGQSQVNVSLTKVNIENVKECASTNINGLDFYIESGNLICECPVTGLRDTIISSKTLSSALSLEGHMILGDKSKIWIIDMINSNSVFESEESNSHYIPVAVHNNIFYFMMHSDKQICICQAKTSTLTALENDGNLNCSNKYEAASSQEVLIAELNSMISSLMVAGKPIPITPQMQSLFDKIDALDELLDSALTLYKFNSIYKPLLYTLQKKVYLKNDEKLICTVSTIIINIDLMEYLVFRGNNFYDGVNLLEMSCKQLCITFISKMDFDIASICWLKYSELKLTLSPEDIIEILNAIPYNTKMSAIIIWFKNFVPTLVEHNPFCIDLFVRWAMERIFILEQSNYWPKIGLKFIEEIGLVLGASLKIICVRPISMDDLDIVKDRLNYILELKEKYKINILLSELSSQNPSEVALIMLRRCYTEDLEVFLQDYLPIYATRHLFEMDEVLQNYIETDTASSGGTVDGARLDIILNAFRSLSSKLECLLNVLKVLDVPWSSKVLQLATNAATSATKDFTVSDSDRVMAQEIQQELSYANVKVVLKKYDLPLTCADYVMVMHKLINAPVIDTKDLKAITTIMPCYTNYGHTLYINKCLENNDARLALDYFYNLPQKDKSILIKTIMTKFEQIINGSSCNKMVERNYIDFMKGTHLLNNIQINNIDNLYHLKNSYSIKLDMNDLYKDKNCADKYNIWVRNIKETRDSNDYDRRTSNVNEMQASILTSEKKPSSLLMMLRGVSATRDVRTFVESLITENSEKNCNSSSVLSELKDGQNASLLLDACNVVIELVNRCQEEHLHDTVTLLSILNAIVNSSITVKNLTIAWKFNYMFLPISPSSAVNEYIDIIQSMRTYKNLEKNISNLQNTCDFISFRVISNVIATAGSNEALLENTQLIKQTISKRLLSRVIAAQELDAVLTTILLIILKKCEEAENDLNVTELLRGQSESLSPSVTEYLSTPEIRRTFYTCVQGSPIASSPHHILKSKFNINLSDITLPENNEETWDVKFILFYVLKHHPETSCERMLDLCKALNISMNDGLSLQLIALLTTWDLTYKTLADDIGCSQLYVEQNTSNFERCCVIWDNIESKDFVNDVLKDFWKNGEVTLHGRVVSVNPYYYEVFLCIHFLIFGASTDCNSMKEYYLLNFLKDYKRISAPKQYEYELFSVKGMFPEIGHYRLPFHLFMREDMWSNLKSEITLETYERWLPVVPLLSLDKDFQIAKDMICSNALKQTMTTRKREDGTGNITKEKESWRLTNREEPLLRAAHRCVRHIANMEWAGACLFYVLQGCTRGADQVAAAHLCYQFAQRWAALQPGNRAVKQMERMHSTLSTRHVLFKVDWACEELARLSTEPAQLIRTLYLHPEFVNKIARHDINRAANEIADKNNINISSIRIQILENLLDKSAENNIDKRSALNSIELMTAKYILKATCPKMGAIYLSRIAFDDDSDYNKCKKMRALQCLMSIVEPDTALKVTNRERGELWISLLELLSAVKLENVDMPWVVATFMQDKCRALEQLLQAGGNAECLRITADLAYYFGNSQIIRNLITMLLRSSLLEEMIPLLFKLSGPPDNIICAAWRAVIMSPFQRADYPITDRQKMNCIRAMNLLPICPVINDDDLKDVWKNCVRLKNFGLGCLMLPYMTPQARQSLTELQKIDRRNLIASLKNLHADTYLVSGAMHVIERMTSSKVYK